MYHQLKQIFSILTAITALLGAISQGYAKGNSMDNAPLTNIHKALVQEDRWLNTERPLKAEELKGRIILVDFWTFCCINCIHVIPELQELEESFGKDLTVIGVHSAKFQNEKDSENIRQAILRYGIEHPVINDSDFRIWQTFGVRAWPTLALINPLGQVDRVYSGEGHTDALRDDINRLRKKYADILNTSPLPIALEEDKSPETILRFPGKLAYAKDSSLGEVLFISDSGHHQIVATTLEGKIVARIGSGKQGYIDGDFSEARFDTPQGILFKDDILYVTDTENHLLRQINLKTKKVITLAGTGEQGFDRYVSKAPALRTSLASPWDLAFYPDDKHIAIAMAGTHQLWSYDIAKKTVSVLAGNGRESIDDGRYPQNSLSQPSGLSVVGDKLYFVDSETSSLRVLENDKVTTLIGTGLFDFGYKEGMRKKALMQHSLGVYADAENVYIADSYNHSIRRYNPKKKFLHNYAGDGKRGNEAGKLEEAAFNEPNDIIRIDDILYVTDTNNHSIRTVNIISNEVSTLPIIPVSTESNYSFADSLPNERALKEAVIQVGGDNNVMLNLPNDWKINEDAPSWLALFDKNGKKASSIAQFSTKEIKTTRITLPELEANHDYHLQGTLYYCEDTPRSVCLIQSINEPLQVITEQPSGITVDFMMPVQ